MVSKGLKVNNGKTEVMVSSRGGTQANIKAAEARATNSKYLAVTISEEG